jgi:hypothetical protein
MAYLDPGQATDTLLQTCLAHLDNLLVQSTDPQQVAQARALKEEVLRLRIRLSQRQLAGADFTPEETQVLENVVPALMAALAPPSAQ